MQADAFNRSKLQTVVVVSVTTNVKLAAAPGNIVVPRRGTGLRRPSVVNVTQVSTVDRRFLLARIGRLAPACLEQVEQGLKLVLEL